MPGRRDTKRPRRLRALALGAVAMYFFDPARGNARRAKLRDRLNAAVNRGRKKAEQKGRYLTAQSR
jgi:hypothetical protein